MSSEKAIVERLDTIIKRQNERLKRAEDDADLIDDNSLDGSELLEDAYNKHKRSVNLKYTALVSLPIVAIIALFAAYLFKSSDGKLDKLAIIHLIAAFCFLFIYIVFVFLIQRMALSGVNKVTEAILKALAGKKDITIENTGEKIFADTYRELEALCANYQSACEDLDKTVEIAKEAGEAKNHFFSNMSHEIRTPLSAMLGLCEMIQREATEPKIRDYAKDIAGAGRTLLLFINDAFDISKLRDGKLEIVPEDYDLSVLINDITNMSLKRANDKGINFTVHVDEAMPHILWGDDLRIKQCLLNIISNGIKFTNEGRVKLDISYTKANDSSILATFVITDTGKGMSERDLDKILNPVSWYEEDRTKTSQGIGLGMTVTKKVLNMMGSELRAESTYGVGSTFKFTVEQKVIDWEPIGNFEEAFKLAREAEESNTHSFIMPDANILVVDDSTVNLMIAEGLLKDSLASITLKESGEKAVEECTKQHFDLILLDHMMPQMDGIETL
ncbi:MAG: response regulator, partial [Lachnospiraceae bacterium]|nr:response regulator [Lachnospiraceae bacterium]